MNHFAHHLIAVATLAAAAAAQGPDFLVTFSQPERTLSGSGGTVLQSLLPNEIVQIAWSSSTCTSFSAEKWSPRTAFHTMAGDEDGDGVMWNPTLFGAIDALLANQTATTVAGVNQRTVFWSPTAAMGTNVSAAPLRPGDVGRIIRNGLGDGQVQHFMRQEQFNLALGLPPATPIDVDAIAFQPNFGVWFSLDADILAPLACGPTLIRDGDVVCVPGGALAYTPDLRIAGVAPGSAVVVYTEAQMDAFVVNAAVTDRFGACVPNAVDTESLEIDPTGPAVAVIVCGGVALPTPRLIFSTETMTGGSLLTTAGGGSILPRPCGLVGTPCGGGPTFGPQIGLRQPLPPIGVPSHVNAIASARVCHHVLEAQQPVMNVFPIGAPFGSTQIDYGTQFAFNFALIELVSPVVPVSLPAAPFSLLCFPDLYAPSVIVHAWPLLAPWGSFPMVAIPPFFTGKLLFQNVGFGGSGFELSTPVVIDVQ